MSFVGKTITLSIGALMLLGLAGCGSSSSESCDQLFSDKERIEEIGAEVQSLGLNARTMNDMPELIASAEEGLDEIEEIVNRYPDEWSCQADGVTYQFDSYEKELLLENIEEEREKIRAVSAQIKSQESELNTAPVLSESEFSENVEEVKIDELPSCYKFTTDWILAAKHSTDMAALARAANNRFSLNRMQDAQKLYGSLPETERVFTAFLEKYPAGYRCRVGEEVTVWTAFERNKFVKSLKVTKDLDRAMSTDPQFKRED
jgi:hypothetical protein